MHGGKYPTLHDIARDLLAIPITSVASESAFSSASIKDVAEIEGVFSSLIMDDSTVEDNTSKNVLDVDMDGGDDAIGAASLID
ncbi:hypothetical protein LINGRAHAP2_LOCUS15339 [Linum grandiflorum]